MRVLITGASSGIGKQLALRFAKRGYDLFLVARREELLVSLKEEIENEYHVDCDYLTIDLVNNTRKIYEYTKDKNYSISILVNNAGFGDYSKFLDSDIEKAKAMIDLNNTALVELTYYYAADMKKNGYGHIINVGSVASFMPGPYMAVYYATKSFVMSFSMALREELRKDGVRVSVLCPAPTKSDFWEVANGQTTSVYNNIFARTVENAADTGMEIFDKNKAYEIDGLMYKLAVGLVRHTPLELSARIIGFVQSKTKKAKR